MALMIDDATIEELAQQVAALRGVETDEAITQALRHELDRLSPSIDVERAVRFCRDLRTRAEGARALPVGKDFFDELSGQP